MKHEETLRIEEGPPRDHCVIGRESHGRTWCDEKGAIEHAKRLLAATAKSTNKPHTRLFVVKVVKVVELQDPPMNVREFEPGDIT